MSVVQYPPVEPRQPADRSGEPKVEAFPGTLPDAVEGDSTEREHPGTGEPMEAVEGTPDGTEHELVEPKPKPRKRSSS